MPTLVRELSRAFGLAALLAFALPALADGPAVGSAAPNFRLQDQEGKWHTLEQYRGKWVVLYFYPKDGTPGCTTQACELRDNIFAFRQANAQILGVSTDDVASKKGFAADNKLPFPVLADPTKATSKSYDVLNPVFGWASRETFLVDPDGRIAKHWPDVKAKEHSALVLAELKARQAKSAPAAAPAPVKKAG